MIVGQRLRLKKATNAIWSNKETPPIFNKPPVSSVLEETILNHLHSIPTEESEKFHSNGRKGSPTMRDDIELPRDWVDPLDVDSGEKALVQFFSHCSF
jgi:hypothetical protein